MSDNEMPFGPSRVRTPTHTHTDMPTISQSGSLSISQSISQTVAVFGHAAVMSRSWQCRRQLARRLLPRSSFFYLCLLLPLSLCLFFLPTLMLQPGLLPALATQARSGTHIIDEADEDNVNIIAANCSRNRQGITMP